MKPGRPRNADRERMRVKCGLSYEQVRRKSKIFPQLAACQDDAARRLTRQMDEREEIKRKAIGEAKMPVEGLTFDDEGVYVDGVPISQLGEARQIMLGIAIVLARNPKLRLIRIPHGEALDEETLAQLATMAEEKDFYIWMAKVDSSGKVGIYLEDGEVKAVNE